MKDVFRYLDTGKMVGLASKANEQSSINLESRDNSLPVSCSLSFPVLFFTGLNLCSFELERQMPFDETIS